MVRFTTVFCDILWQLLKYLGNSFIIRMQTRDISKRRQKINIKNVQESCTKTALKEFSLLIFFVDVNWKTENTTRNPYSKFITEILIHAIIFLN